MKCLVIGFGSIGKRHATILCDFGCKVFLVSHQKINNYVTYKTIDEAFKKDTFDYIVIANETYLHLATLVKLTEFNYKGCVLVEKPLSDQKAAFILQNNLNIFVGYNLRFHKTLSRLKQLLEEERLISFSARVGQYLPTWHVDKDYRDNYSAKKKLGGGVLRDLSHELDYAIWMCGDPVEVTALGGKFSSLEIDSDDTCSILMRCRFCPIVAIHMDYLSRMCKREIYVQTAKHTFFADLINNFLLIDEKKEYFESTNTYMDQHKAIFQKDFGQLCSFDQAMKVGKLIASIEEAVQKKKWMCS